ncbi:MAG: nuclear transport factor 2 family protein [Acidimicrobiia bacterium]
MPSTDHAADLIAIAALQARYADVVSRQAFGELAELFVPDAHLFMELPGHTKELVGPQAFGDYVARRIAHLEFFQFVITGAVAEPDGDRATGRMHFYELHQDREQHRLRHLYGVYRDEFVRIDGRWWFAQRRFAPLAMTSTDDARDLDVFPSPF